MDADRVRCTIYLLKGDASLWWEGAEQGVNLATLTWEDFKSVLYDKYFTTDVRSRLKREFISLRQHLSVAEFVQKFDRGCHFVPLIALDGLRPTIRHDVMLTGPVDYTTVVAKAFRAEQSLKHIDWEMQRNRNHAQQASQHNKKPYIGPPKRLGQPKLQGQPPKENVSKTTEKPIFKECYRHHYGKCMWGTYKCFKCRAMGHKAGDFQKLKQPMTGRAYVMHAEKAKPDMTLITTGIATYALLDSGATYSFISESFVKKLGILPVDVESEFKVTLPFGEHMVSSNMVKDVELKLQRNIIRADLIRSVSIRPPNGKTTIFEEAQNKQMTHIISCIRAKKLIQKGSQVFIASIISAPDTDSRSIEDVEVVKDFPDVFPDNVFGIPPEREVEFAIELMSSTMSISKYLDVQGLATFILVARNEMRHYALCIRMLDMSTSEGRVSKTGGNSLTTPHSRVEVGKHYYRFRGRIAKDGERTQFHLGDSGSSY
ncbi:uncharacterized protein LOC142534834 [Primulina tabacum]|uniref:uncharacterized protein LOC142534834 n=1 Tax=Primulina tabacum TaxID=48773 RepID=UPI003F59F2D5